MSPYLADRIAAVLMSVAILASWFYIKKGDKRVENVTYYPPEEKLKLIREAEMLAERLGDKTLFLNRTVSDEAFAIALKLNGIATIVEKLIEITHEDEEWE